MDVVGRFLQEAAAELAAAGCQYVVEYTVPTRDYFEVDEHVFYVIRQKLADDGSYHLIAAAKMRKEV